MAGPNLRITGGALRGRMLRATRNAKIRSTSAKVRSAIFNIVGPVEGLAVADLYCGSGALGIEALSRGAGRVVAVDNSRLGRQLTLANIAQLDPGLQSRFRFVRARVQQWILDPANGAPFDLVLLDPPYSQLDSALEAIAGIIANGVLGPDGLAVCEHSARQSIPAGEGFHVADSYRYGDSALTLVRGPSPEPGGQN